MRVSNLMQIGTPVKFSPSLEVSSNPIDSSFELRLDLNFASFIQQPDY